MFSDTHFHYEQITRGRGLDGVGILKALLDRNTFFAQDIGTKCDDLPGRIKAIEEDISALPVELQQNARDMVHYSVGIWPDVDSIKDRFNKIEIMKKYISEKNVIAIGECGLDHHWNPSGNDGRDETDFNKNILLGEKELFEMQIEIAKNCKLPVIVHSRDAFLDTFDCIKNVGYDNGIIHCYSYGLEEAKAFLDRGWYISFSGSVTYTKKSKMQEMRELISYIPDDRILLETDAPYLAPVPKRGSINTPEYVEHTYAFCAEIRGISSEKLSEIVDKNIKMLF